MNITFHIGLHKTATTTFQRDIFPACQDLQFLQNDPRIDAFVRAAATRDTAYFDAEYYRTMVKKSLSESKPALISKEALSGALYAGIGKRNLDHRTPILENLRATAPEAKVVLILRRQDRLALSLYRQYLKVGGTERVDAFFGLDRNAQAIFPTERFLFRAYVDKLKELFPAGALILPFELFSARPTEFLDRLCNFLGTPTPSVEIKASNQSRFGHIGLEMCRIANYACKSRLNRYGLLPRIMPYIQDNWPIKGKIATGSRLYRAGETILQSSTVDNRQLDQSYHLQLGEFGYY